MPKNIRLPEEVISIILEYVSRQDLIQYRLICRNWYLPATRLLFREVMFNSLQHFQQFLDAFRPTSFQYPPASYFIKGLIFSGRFTGSLSSQQFEILVKQCPNVEVVLSLNDRFEKHIAYHLLSISNELQWRRLKSLPDSYHTFDLHHKYRNSLVEVHTNEFENIDNFDFLQLFPCVRELDIPNLPIHSLNELRMILKVCPHLQFLRAQLPPDDRHELTEQQYSLLKGLRAVQYRNCHGEALEYLMNASSQLQFLHLEVDSTAFDDPLEQTTFRQIAAKMYMRSQFRLSLSTERKNDIRLILREYLDGLCQPEHLSSSYTKLHFWEEQEDHHGTVCFSADWKRKKDNDSFKLNMAIRPSVYFFQDLPRYIGKFGLLLKELYLDRREMDNGQEDARTVMNIIKQFSVLHTLGLGQFVLPKIDPLNIRNTSIESVDIGASFIYPQFLLDLSICCPNLKYLCLESNQHKTQRLVNLHNGENSWLVSLSMPQTHLETFKFWLCYRRHPLDEDRPVWIMEIKTDTRELYYRISYDQDEPKKITSMEAHMLSSSGQVRFQCKEMKQFILNGVIVDL
ncbi:hypothetical protein RMATCC62417_10010 [Rhizopus microsporus]|nr:hypothetical protein RMATCC62417_10010 [Rhizopus microsporus]